MRVWHGVPAHFDDPNLVGVAGLVPAVALAEKAWLHELVAEQVSVPGSAGANAAVKVSALVAGMVAGADSFEDLDVFWHGAMTRLFGGLRAPTTLARICGPIGSGMSASWTRSPPGSWRTWPSGFRGCSRAGTRWPTST